MDNPSQSLSVPSASVQPVNPMPVTPQELKAITGQVGIGMNKVDARAEVLLRQALYFWNAARGPRADEVVDLELDHAPEAIVYRECLIYLGRKPPAKSSTW